MFFFITCILLVECAHAFEARIKDRSVADVVHVECRAKKGVFERFKGPLEMKITFQVGPMSAEVAKAFWQRSGFSLTGVEGRATVHDGALCDSDPFCITYKQPAPFGSDGKFVCNVNDNGNEKEDAIYVDVEGLTLATHYDHFSFLFS